MREIKFRAWNKYNVYCIMTHFELSDLYWMGEETGMYDFPENEIVMQYTGLKDKNGVEIYEGDICKRGKWKPAVVEWDSENCLFDFKDSYNLTLMKSKSSELEVIGNIYENPELLQ